jgi:hypothetical protein
MKKEMMGLLGRSAELARKNDGLTGMRQSRSVRISRTFLLPVHILRTTLEFDADNRKGHGCELFRSRA